MAKKPYFSVIIPTLNEELFIGGALESVQKQTYADYEVIVIDGNSEDKTKQVAMGFESKIPLVFYTTKTRSVSYQRNLGAKKSHGQYLIFLDADSRVDRKFLAALRRRIDRDKHLLFIPTLVPQSRRRIDKMLFNIVNLIVEFSQYTDDPFAAAGVTIIERNLFFHVGGFDLSQRHGKKQLFPEDRDILIKTKKCGIRATYLKDISIQFSLRRFDREGRYEVSKKYILSMLQYSQKSAANLHIPYEMGGHLYGKTVKDSKLKLRKDRKVI